jgi:hypothetical protein
MFGTDYWFCPGDVINCRQTITFLPFIFSIDICLVIVIIYLIIISFITGFWFSTRMQSNDVIILLFLFLCFLQPIIPFVRVGFVHHRIGWRYESLILFLIFFLFSSYDDGHFIVVIFIIYLIHNRTPHAIIICLSTRLVFPIPCTRSCTTGDSTG